MPYDSNDRRSQLGSTRPATNGATTADSAAAPEYFEFFSLEPDSVSELGSRSWYVRSQTGGLVYSEAVAGECLSRSGQVDEYVTVLVSTPSRPAAHIDIVANDESALLTDDAIVVLPPGDSEVIVTSPGTVVRVFSNQSGDLAEGARNAVSHADQHPHVAPFTAWPAAPTGDHMRVYRMVDVPVDPSRFGNIFRCSTVMINVINADPGARDPGKMSPHFHDDFEHFAADRRRLRPPHPHARVDFSLRSGWVLNHDDYPDIPSG